MEVMGHRTNRLKISAMSLLVIWILLLVVMVIQADVSVTYKHNGLTCNKCNEGEFLVDHCRIDFSSSNCSSCPDNTFQETLNVARSCESCQPHCFDRNEIQESPCTKTHNIKCHCKDGYYRKDEGPSQYSCLKHTICDEGYVVITKGTREADTKCGRCESGTFFTKNNSSDSGFCQDCSKCEGSDFKEETACNFTSDAVCIAVPNDVLSSGIIVAIVVVSVVFLVIIGVIIFFTVRRCRRIPQQRPPSGANNSEYREHRSQESPAGVSESQSRPDGIRSEDAPLLKSPSERPVSVASVGDENLQVTPNPGTDEWREPVFKCLSQNLGHDWKMFIRELPGDEDWTQRVNACIQQAEANHKYSVGEQIYQTLLKWNEECYDRVTARAIMKALRTQPSDIRRPTREKVKTVYDQIVESRGESLGFADDGPTGS